MFSIEFASRWTAARAWIESVQMPAAENATIRIGHNTFSGSATGKRFEATVNGVIYSSGAGASYLPGNAAGTTATGGQYI